MNIFGLSLDTFIILAFVLVLFIIAMMIICLKLGNISFKQDVIIDRLRDTNELITNVVQGSKRIERDVDAINQRTRAAANRKTKTDNNKRGGYDNKNQKSSHAKNNTSKRNNSSVRK